MKLHWSPRSPFVRKVMIVAHECGLADRLQCVRTVAEMTKPHAELMRDNPLSKIPTLVLDDGTALYDSPVICEYLDGLGGEPKLFPQQGRARTVALAARRLATDSWICWCLSATSGCARSRQRPTWRAQPRERPPCWII